VTTTQEPAVHGDAHGGSAPDEPSGGPSTVDWVPVEPWPGPPPVPVLAPYLGLVAAVLCALGGGWLLLAPYALDFRHGADRVPRTAAVDLETGAAIVAVAIVTAALFSIALVRRLRANPAVEPETEAELGYEPEPETEPEPESGAQPEAAGPPVTQPQQADPGGALRELLTPLVAALAADLRSHDQEHGARHYGAQENRAQESRAQGNRAQESRDEHRRQEP
jgi:hypothetical protein